MLVSGRPIVVKSRVNSDGLSMRRGRVPIRTEKSRSKSSGEAPKWASGLSTFLEVVQRVAVFWGLLRLPPPGDARRRNAPPRTSAQPVGAPQDPTLLDLAERREHDPDVVLVALLGHHADEQLPVFHRCMGRTEKERALTPAAFVKNTATPTALESSPTPSEVKPERRRPISSASDSQKLASPRGSHLIHDETGTRHLAAARRTRQPRRPLNAATATSTSERQATGGREHRRSSIHAVRVRR